MIGRVKTPGVRDLVSSEPYFHTGQMNTIEDVLNFYLTSSSQARAGTLRNADPQLSGIFLDNSAVAPLAAFLRSLDESDYADIPCPCPFP
jgi:cytochrome c peroxidase